MNKPTLKEQAHGEIEKIFRILLPQNGLAVREEQITLCHAMLDTLLKNNIALCDAGVGIGKTYAYLTACILLKKFAPHGPAGSQPVVISTSSVALQDAIIGEYIPFLSRIFLENRVISKPIRAIVRKGKERFACDARLSQRLEAVKDKNKNAEQLKALLSLRTYYDLDSVTGLSGFDRRQVCVPKVCEKTCPLRSVCRYHQYLKEARSAEIFVRICNHNYLLADAAHRLQELRPLLNDYRALVIDEAHKLPDAAQQMYGRSLSAEDFSELCTLLAKEKYVLAAQRLKEKFTALMGAMCRGELLEEAQRTAFVLTPDREAALRDCLSFLRQLQKQLAPHLPRWILYRLGTTEQTLNLFFTGDRKYILYIQYDRDGSPSLCAASREMPEQLRHALWLKETPAILTSGTLMAGGSFDRTRQLMGLSANKRLDDYIAVSPFNYKENCLLYIPDDYAKGANGQRKRSQVSGRADLPFSGSHSWPHSGAFYFLLPDGRCLYGYYLDEKGTLIVQQEEAKIVQKIFGDFLSGMGIQEIAAELQKEQIPKLNGEPVWSYTGILYILTNERYIGDELFQKRYTSDTLPFQKKINRGQKKQYYAEDTHDPIISREVFRKAQELLKRKSERHGHQNNGQYTFTSLIVCDECGTNFCRRIAKNQRVLWTCRKHFKGKHLCSMESLNETEIQQCFLTLYKKLAENRQEILGSYLRQLEELKDKDFMAHPDAMELNRQIAGLLEQNHTLHRLRAKECIDSAFFIAQSNELGQKISNLKAELKQYRNLNEYADFIDNTRLILTILDSPMPAFSASVFRNIVSRITVTHETLRFQLVNGLELEEERISGG